MSYEPWKEFERRFAKLMGGVRLWRPDFSDSDPDGESDTHTWDCKVRASHAAVGTYVDCEKKYRKHANGRRFILALYSRKHPKAGDFVLLRAADYAKDQEELSLCRPFLEALYRERKAQEKWENQSYPCGGPGFSHAAHGACPGYSTDRT